ncbi:MAG TPA: hypothetical protein PLK30_12510, partial [Blastocatellia bacterium]|nr:hypothetical protein [Blastocatellia bacterium]
SFVMGWMKISESRINEKNGFRGLAFGLATLILLCLVLLMGANSGYTGRCHQRLWYDDLGTPCSRVEYFSRNADFGIGIGLLAG